MGLLQGDVVACALSNGLAGDGQISWLAQRLSLPANDATDAVEFALCH